MSYEPASDRYDRVPTGWFRRCGSSGLFLPSLSLGCWHNFGTGADHALAQQMLFHAFDLGITHFDLANNYGPEPGSAEERVGRILREMPRDEIIISTKAGYRMWPGPYGDLGSRKSLLASLDQSLRRMRLEYVDVFYSHRMDPETPLEETLGALDSAVKQGKALYAGISNYSAERTLEVFTVCREGRLTRPVIHQPRYSMFDRWIEADLISVAQEKGLGLIPFSPLAQGLLSDRYLGGIPADSRAGSATGFLRPDHVTDEKLARVRKLDRIAKRRGQKLAQMALQWVLRWPAVCSALIGASSVAQIEENVAAASGAAFATDELTEIDAILA
jgi:L-glyceraldehyde 3-phosphate reductase